MMTSAIHSEGRLQVIDNWWSYQGGGGLLSALRYIKSVLQILSCKLASIGALAVRLY
jgi:hypothetical protein